MIRSASAALFFVLATSSLALAQSCGGEVAVQVLGSGGPAIRADRASASYLLWIDSRARMLVDAGGGAFARFGQAQARFADLAFIGLSHFHPDHVSDLPALFWAGRQTRSDTLPIAGPSGNEVAPSLATFLSRLFDGRMGAFQVLGPILEPQPGAAVVRLDPRIVDVTQNEPVTVFEGDGLRVMAKGIPHGNLPTLAYRAEVRGASVVFSSDQTASDPRFVDFAKGAEVLIMHLATDAQNSPLHASPAVVGRVAQAAGVGRLIVSHIGLFDLDRAIAELKMSYHGPLIIGADLQCTPVR